MRIRIAYEVHSDRVAAIHLQGIFIYRYIVHNIYSLGYILHFILLFSELAKESSSLVDPVVLRLAGRQLHSHHKVSGMT